MDRQSDQPPRDGASATIPSAANAPTASVSPPRSSSGAVNEETVARIRATIDLVQSLDVITSEDMAAISQNITETFNWPPHPLPEDLLDELENVLRTTRRAPGVPEMQLQFREVGTAETHRTVAPSGSRHHRRNAIPGGTVPQYDFGSATAGMEQAEVRRMQRRRQQAAQHRIERERRRRLYITDWEQQRQEEDEEDAEENREL